MLHPFLTGSLNRDICKHTFGFLDKCALAVCRQVCTTWRDLIRRPEPWTTFEVAYQMQLENNPGFVHITRHIYILPVGLTISAVVQDAIQYDRAWALDWILRRNTRDAERPSVDMSILAVQIARAPLLCPKVCAWYWDRCQYTPQDRARCFWTFFYEANVVVFRAMLEANVVEVKKLIFMTDFRRSFHDEWLARTRTNGFAELEKKCAVLHESHWGMIANFWDELCDSVWRDTRKKYSSKGIDMLRAIGRAIGKLPSRFCLNSRFSPIYETKRMHDAMCEGNFCACPPISGTPFVPDPTAYPTPALLNMTNKKRTRDDEPPPN